MTASCSSSCGLSVGARVRVQGLQTRPEFNGEDGVLLDFQPEEGRWRVVTRGGHGLSLRPENLAPALGLDLHVADGARSARPLRVRVAGPSGGGALDGQEGTLCGLSEADGTWRVVLDSGRDVNLSGTNLELLLSSDDEEWACVEEKCLGCGGGAGRSAGDTPERLSERRGEGMQPGAVACIARLKARPDIDGKAATLMEYIAEEGRWKVQLEGSGESKFIREEHLQLRWEAPKPAGLLGSSSPLTERVALEGEGGHWQQQEGGGERERTREENPQLRREESALRRGMRVRVVGLRNRTELNGQEGRLLEYAEKAGRWQVRLDDGSGKQLIPENLEVVQAGAAQAEAAGQGTPPAGGAAPAAAPAAPGGAAARQAVAGRAGAGGRAPDLRERFRRFLATGERVCIPDAAPRGAGGRAGPEPGGAAAAPSGGAAASEAAAAQGGGRAGGLEAGDRVVVTGLKTRPEVNGKCGCLLEFDEPEGRWHVVLDDGSGLSLRPANVQRHASGGSAASSSKAQPPQRAASRGPHQDPAQACGGKGAGSSSSSGSPATPGRVAAHLTGARVRVHGLLSRPEFNGQLGTLVGEDEGGRWRVALDSGQGLSLRPWNLQGLGGPAEELWGCSEGDQAPSRPEEGDRRLRSGMRVRVRGLVGRPELNGRLGSLLELDAYEGRWRVMLDSGSGFSLRPENVDATSEGASPSGGCEGAAGGGLALPPAKADASGETWELVPDA